MLHRLEIENFYSIRDKQTIDLCFSPRPREDERRLAPTWRGAAERTPKVVALFGANASGKSNVLKALSFVIWFVKDSFGLPPGGRLPFERFNDEAMLTAPTRLAIHFSGLESKLDASEAYPRECRYAYEVTLGGTEPCRVEYEALHYWPSHAARRVRVFERTGEGKVLAGKSFEMAGYRPALEKILRPEVSVIATLAQLGHPLSLSLRGQAERVVTNILFERGEITDDSAIRIYAEWPELLKKLNEEIQKLDVGIRSMRIEAGQSGPVAWFTHDGLARDMKLILQSHGTRQFLKIYPALVRTLEIGGVAVLDELDVAIHPLLLPEILRWFYDPGRNPHDAQLWISCHSASLLEELSKEEVLFCEKNRKGITSIYGLADIKSSERRTDNHYRKYMGGLYGAVPQIG